MMAPGNYLLICFAFHWYMILTMLCVLVYRRTCETSWASCWGKTSHGLLSSQQCSSGCISCTKSKMPQIYLNLDYLFIKYYRNTFKLRQIFNIFFRMDGVYNNCETQHIYWHSNVLFISNNL
jgi:hypothetical protein